MRSVLVLLGLVLAQVTSTQQPQQAPSTASIEGAVVRFGTTDGVSRAKVTLTPTQSSVAGQAVIVDADGKFAFRSLPAGPYRINASRDGYVPAEYGQRGPNGSGVAITLTAQQHATDIRIGMTSTGAIGGRIVNRYGEPVGNANVQALRYTYQDGRRVLNTVQTARTNDRGEYRLFWMAPGQYIVSAQPQEQISVDAGGTIFFQTARGGPGGPLGANLPQLGVGGVTRVMVTGANAPGEFIGGVGPGGPPPPPPPPPPVPVDNPETYMPVYFPGTTDVASATSIDLRAGGNIDGVDLTVVDVRPVRIRGQVLNGGRPAAGAQVSLYQRSNLNGNLTVRGTTVSDTGTFEFRNVAPGSYEAAASLNGAGPTAMIIGGPLGNAARVTIDNAGVGRGRTPGQPVMGVRVPVDVNTADIDGVSLVLENGYNLAGKMTVDGVVSNDVLASLTNVRFQLQSDPLIPNLAIPPTNPEADGTFVIVGVTAGTYRLNVAGLPRNMYVKTARFGGTDVYSNGLRIEGDPRGQLDIVVGSTPGSLDTVVLDEKQMPEAGVTVALIPDPSQVKRIDMYRNATSDAMGKVHWDGVVPGDYKIYAWEDIENGAWADPEFMRNYDGRGTAVHIDDRGHATVNVKVIPYKAN